MNLYSIKNFFKYKKNKILACGFSTLASLAFLVYYAFRAISTGGACFQEFTYVWNLIFYLIVFGIITICNYRNDNFAYQGILMFIFYMTLNALQMCFYVMPVMLNNLRSANFDPASILNIIYMATIPAMVVVGVILYLNCRRYMLGRSDNFIRIRVLSIIFAVLVSLLAGGTLAMEIVYNDASIVNVLGLYLLMPIAEALLAIAVVFTMERLRRI